MIKRKTSENPKQRISRKFKGSWTNRSIKIKNERKAVI